jgi:hypothetical protein
MPETAYEKKVVGRGSHWEKNPDKYRARKQLLMKGIVPANTCLKHMIGILAYAIGAFLLFKATLFRGRFDIPLVVVYCVITLGIGYLLEPRDEIEGSSH